MCVRDYSYACVGGGGGVGTPTARQHNIFDSGGGKLSQLFLVHLTGFESRVFGSVSPTLYQLSHPVTPIISICIYRFLYFLYFTPNWMFLA